MELEILVQAMRTSLPHFGGGGRCKATAEKRAGRGQQAYDNKGTASVRQQDGPDEEDGCKEGGNGKGSVTAREEDLKDDDELR